MNKKPTKYTYEDKESGMVSEPSAAMACNQPAVHMEIMRNEDHNDEAWAEWAKHWTPEFKARVDSYDDDDPTDPNQTWYTQEEMFASLEQHIRDYASRMGRTL